MNEKSKKAKKKVPLWAQVIAILLIGVLTSCAVWLIGRDQKMERHNVTFAYGDGTVIEKKEVKDGQGVFPPILKLENTVFRGWSSPINYVTQDIEVHPSLYTIVEDNLFYIDAAYVKEGKKLKLPLMLGGQVNVSSGELTVEYDPEVLTLNKAENNNVCKANTTASGVLTITFSSEEILTQTTQLTTLEFYAKKKDVYATEIVLSGTKVTVVVNGKEKPADFATINNKVYFLQEVSK